MEAYYTAKLLPSKNNTAQIWRNKNQDSKPDIDTNNLANECRYIERQQKLTPTELQEIKDRVGWANNIPAQMDPPREPTQPPPNLEIIPQDENKQENRAAQQTPEDEEMKKSGKRH